MPFDEQQFCEGLVVMGVDVDAIVAHDADGWRAFVDRLAATGVDDAVVLDVARMCHRRAWTSGPALTNEQYAALLARAGVDAARLGTDDHARLRRLLVDHRRLSQAAKRAGDEIRVLFRKGGSLGPPVKREVLELHALGRPRFELAGDSGITAMATEAAGLPKTVGGEPARYYRKDLISEGVYTHPLKRFKVPVDGARIRRWADTGNRMLAAGVDVPINVDHIDAADANRGWVKRFDVGRNDAGDVTLFALCQAVGDDAATCFIRNRVSVGIDPDFVDGRDRTWGDAIVHVALTPIPVVPGQGDFVALSVGGPLIPCLSRAEGREPGPVAYDPVLQAEMIAMPNRR